MPAPDAPVPGQLFLTFDDGPDPEWTPRVLDLLAQAQARATFFVIGAAALRAPATVRRIAAEGHAIGNHSSSHRHPWTMSTAAARAQVRDGAAAIADLTGSAPRHYRPPHGRLRRCMVEEAAAGGQQLALWSLSAIDWGPLGRADGIARRLARARPGDVVLMHDGGRGINHPAQLAQVLPAFLDSLPQRGLKPVALRQNTAGHG